jgi:tRNA 2-thiouridine synthesizing protein A
MTIVESAALPTLLTQVWSMESLSCPVASVVDASGLACPLPLLKAKQGLRSLGQGDLLRVLTTDAGSLKDFVSFSVLTGQAIVGFCEQKDIYCFILQK